MQRMPYIFPLYNLPPELKIFQRSFLFFLPFQLDKIKVGGDSCYPQHFFKVSSPYYSYKTPKGKEPYIPKLVDDMKLKYKSLHTHFNYGHTHDIKFTSYSEKYCARPKLKQSFMHTNIKGPKKIWVPKE